MPRSQIVRLSLACLAATLSANAQVILTGRVVDQNDAPVANARVSAHRGPQAPVDAYSGPSGGFRLSLPCFMDIDVGYAHLFVEDPTVDFTDSQGHELRGKFDAAVDVVSAAVTFRWGGSRESAQPVSQPPGKEVVGFRK